MTPLLGFRPTVRAFPRLCGDPGSGLTITPALRSFMTSTFGPNSQRVLALIASIPGLSAGQVDQVISAWKRVSPSTRAGPGPQLSRITAEDERSRILAAAALARREALDTAR